jgi:hypothetical protein
MGRAKTFGVGREYDYPLNQLLILGRPTGEVTDAAFVDELGLTADHAPQLIRMATDPALGEAFDYPAIYAWRALAKFRHEPAIGPLVALLRAQRRSRGSKIGSGRNCPKSSPRSAPPHSSR